jgi:tRNA A-37 threonylcarbamoyl transferase component Bud32
MPASAKARNETPPDRLLTQADPERVLWADPAARERVGPLLQTGGGEWERVKRNDSRTVWRSGRGGPGCFYLKHFHSRAPIHRIRRRVSSDAVRELRHSEYLSAHGVPVPRILAAYRRGDQEWLISEGIEPAEPADRWHDRRLLEGDDAAIQAATVALAELIGRMHRAGVLHHDLHCGNVLVRGGRGDDLVLMDLHRMSRRRRLSRHDRAANLAQLFSDRRLWTTRSQRLRFLRRYLRASGAEGTVRGWVRMVQPLAMRHDRCLNAKRERRIFGNNRYFARLNVAGYRTHVVRASKRRVPGSKASTLTFTRDQWREILGDPEALLTGEGVRIIKDSRSSLVVRRKLRIGEHELDVFIKRPRRKHWRRVVTDLFRPSRALRAFYLGHSLLARHLYTALPLAAMERRRGPILVDSILITEAVTAGRAADDGHPVGLHLNRFLNRYLGPGRKEDALPVHQKNRLAQQVLWQLGRLVRRLHEEGFAHRDLKATNLLVHWSGGDQEPPAVILVDLDGGRYVGHVSARQEFRGLMRLNVSLLECPAVSHAGRLRMLIGYLRRPGVGRVAFKPYWRQLQQWSDRKIRRQITSRQKRQQSQRRSGS